jgi:hypothetical protein
MCKRPTGPTGPVAAVALLRLSASSIAEVIVAYLICTCPCGCPQALHYLLFQNTLLHSLSRLCYQALIATFVFFASLTWQVLPMRL